MVRPMRIEYAGALFHGTSRGDLHKMKLSLSSSSFDISRGAAIRCESSKAVVKKDSPSRRSARV